MKFSSDWFSHHQENWRRLFHAIGWNPNERKVIVEIGSFEGRSTIWALQNLLLHDDSSIYCLDTWEGGVEHVKEDFNDVWSRFNENMKESGRDAKVIVKRNQSKNSLIDLIKDGVQADFLYIDGSHQAKDVLADLVLGFELVKSGGVIICDDYVWANEQSHNIDVLNNPKIAIDSFTNIYRRNIKLVQGIPLVQFSFIKI